jgi:hypothetical protein
MKPISRRILFGAPIPFLAAQVRADSAAANRPKTTPAVWNRTELYFGTSRPAGAPVSDRQFANFIDTYVTPRFPDGLTLLAGYGQFKTSSGDINKEKSFVLILFYPPQMRDANRNIEELREIYKNLFQQESVLRSDSNSFISF